MRKSISFFITSCLLAQGFAQQAYQFKKGLFANTTVRYGREALYLDELAYRLYNGNLQMPVEGAVFGTDEKGEPVTWQPVEADSLNRLRAPGFGRRSGSQVGFMRGGYIYLTYTSAKEQTALLNIKGNSGVFVNGGLHMGDAYNLGYLHIPVKLKKGLNEFYVRGNSATASLSFPPKAVFLNTDDPTSPCVVLNKQNGLLQAAIVVLNTSDKALKGLQVKSNLQGREAVTDIPDIPAMSSRKIPFTFDGSDIIAKGRFNCSISILEKGKVLDEAKLPVEAVNPSEQYSSTFISHIDGSLQYYAVTPQSSGDTAHAALFLSVHGAGVEAIGQATCCAVPVRTWRGR